MAESRPVCVTRTDGSDLARPLRRVARRAVGGRSNAKPAADAGPAAPLAGPP